VLKEVGPPLKFNVHLQQERLMNQVYTLAGLDSSNKSLERLVSKFHRTGDISGLPSVKPSDFDDELEYNYAKKRKYKVN
jgi:hypothetical protein